MYRSALLIRTSTQSLVINNLKTSCIHYPNRKLCSPVKITPGLETKEIIKPKTLWGNYLDIIRWKAPVGVNLLLIPSGWGIALASCLQGAPPAISTVVLFISGSFFMRGAGCIINDLWDKDFDKQVERTKMRPLASGALSQKAAYGFLLAHLSASLGILLCLQTPTIALGVCSLSLVVMYPLMKRITFWPQAFLGLCMNYGCLMGFTEVMGQISPILQVLPIYLGGLFWTLLYDTIYAYQDKIDDVKIGVKSTAVLFGDDKTPLYLFAGCSSLSFSLAGIACGLPAPYWVGLAVASTLSLHHIKTLDVNASVDCRKKFIRSQDYGWIILGGLIASIFFRMSEIENKNEKFNK